MSATSTDTGYQGITIASVTVTVTDNDSTGVRVSKTTLTVEEEDTTGNSYTVVLDAQPSADVTVTVAGHAGTDVTPNPTTLTFTTSRLEHVPDGNGDRQRRCGHSERFCHADPQRDEHRYRATRASRLPA